MATRNSIPDESGRAFSKGKTCLFVQSGQRPPGVGFAAGQLPLTKSERLFFSGVLGKNCLKR